jgi:hypothetical protein
MTAARAKRSPLRRKPLRDLAAFRALPNIDRRISQRKTPVTAQLQLEQLELFCRRNGMDPVRLIELARQKGANVEAREFGDLVAG